MYQGPLKVPEEGPLKVPEEASEAIEANEDFHCAVNCEFEAPPKAVERGSGGIEADDVSPHEDSSERNATLMRALSLNPPRSLTLVV